MGRDEAKARFDAGAERFNRLVRLDSDPLVLLLKGHLVVEEQLLELISAGVAEPEALVSVHMTFYQKLHFAKAVAGAFVAYDIYEAIRRLNGVRNVLAHQAEPASGESLYSDYVTWRLTQPHFRDRLPEDAPVFIQLHAVLLVCWVTLATVCDVVRVVREHAPIPPGTMDGQEKA